MIKQENKKFNFKKKKKIGSYGTWGPITVIGTGSVEPSQRPLNPDYILQPICKIQGGPKNQFT
jgi:hypothetical protein